MKNLKIVVVFVAICATLFTGCEKDDEDSSSPGYYIIDGVRYNLGKAYFEYYDIRIHHANNKEYLEHTVTFISDGFIWKNGEVISGKGSVAIIQFMDPLKVQIPESGNYVYQSDNDPVKSYTYFDFTLGYFDNENTSLSFYYNTYDSVVKVSKSGDVYEFSCTGKTDKGKAFEFYYKGTIAPMPEIKN